MLAPDDDVFTNHIHADDLARATVAALFRGRPNRAYNVTDDAEMKMGGWFDAVADAFQLPRPPRVSWEEAEQRIAPMLLSFMSESRRLSNARMKRELRVRLRYPTPQALLDEVAPRDLQEAARAAAVNEGAPMPGADPRRRPIAPRRSAVLARLDAYERLVRLDKPIGILLLLWPTLSALWIAARRRADVDAGAGVHAGHDADALGRLRDQRLGRPRASTRTSKRTATRPLARGEIAPWEALRGRGRARALRASCSCSRPTGTTDPAVVPGGRDRRRLSVLQALLRAAAGVPRHRVLVRHPDGLRRRARTACRRSPGGCSPINLFWVIAYDTEYAMVDRDDDLKLGLRTSAITFGRFDVAAVMLCYAIYLAGMVCGRARCASWGRSTTPASRSRRCCALWHWWLIRARDRDALLPAFLHNHWLGFAVFAGVAVDFAVRLHTWPRGI